MSKLRDTEKILNKKRTEVINEYKKFAVKGNAIDMAVGIAIGSAFTAIVNSIVSSIISPVVSLITNNIDLSQLFITIKGEKFATLAEAKAAGSLVITYGELINSIINFLIISFVLFIVVSFMKKTTEKKQTRENSKIVEKNKICPYCFSSIPKEAIKCAYCTSELTKIDVEAETIDTNGTNTKLNKEEIPE